MNSVLRHSLHDSSMRSPNQHYPTFLVYFFSAAGIEWNILTSKIFTEKVLKNLKERAENKSCNTTLKRSLISIPRTHKTEKLLNPGPSKIFSCLFSIQEIFPSAFVISTLREVDTSTWCVTASRLHWGSSGISSGIQNIWQTLRAGGKGIRGEMSGVYI